MTGTTPTRPRRLFACVETALVVGVLALPFGTLPTDAWSEPSMGFTTLYFGRGVRDDLPVIPAKTFIGGLRLSPPSRFTAVGGFRTLPTPARLRSLFDALRIGGTSTGIELIAAKHYGYQDNWEVDGAYLLQLPAIPVTVGRLRPGFGFGVSYALGDTPYEGKSMIRQETHYRLLSYLAIEMEAQLVSAPRVGLVARLHHRSGIYGTIAPAGIGSNFLTLGLRLHY